MPHDTRGRRDWRRPLGLALLLLVVMPLQAAAETVKLPMTLDFTLLRTLIAEQAYPEPGEQASIVAMNEGCNDIRLANPQLEEENGEVRFATELYVSWGTPLGDNCLAPINWSGTIVFRQQPVVDDLWRLRFVIRNSALYNRVGEKAAIPNLIWDLVKQNVHGYIESIAVNLAPPVDSIKQLLLPPGGDEEMSAARSFLASMRAEQPQVKRHGLAINILADADVPSVTVGEPPGEVPVVDPAVQERVMALWRTWDALLVNMIDQLSPKELTVEDRQLLLDTLLIVRYEFSEVIDGPELTTNFVRKQFINSWLALKPLFIRHLTARPSDSMLGYLSFFTAADALVTLDRLGPMLGIDLSREGFYRMAHMLGDRPLDESGAVDAHLRDILGFGPALVPEPAEIPPDEPGLIWPESPEDEGLRLPDGEFEERIDSDPGAFSWPVWRELFGPAEAHAANGPSQETVASWTAELTPGDRLLPRVQQLLARAARQRQDKLDTIIGESEWGQRMVEATAWQESCFRQFVVKDQKITYLLSYNNTSVGVMQVNEKVWRGIYDQQQLRWNIEYNIRSGTEILALYLNRYLAGHPDFKTPVDGTGRRYLATWLYALYNGGPGLLKKFPQRSAAGKLNKVELSFQQKYDRVVGGDWFAEVDCLPAISASR